MPASSALLNAQTATELAISLSSKCGGSEDAARSQREQPVSSQLGFCDFLELILEAP
jgi:hypothetical protein